MVQIHKKPPQANETKKDLESTWQLPQGLQDAEELLEVGAKQWAGKGSGGSSPPGIPPKDPPEISHKDPRSGSRTLSGGGHNHPHVQSYLCLCSVSQPLGPAPIPRASFPSLSPLGPAPNLRTPRVPPWGDNPLGTPVGRLDAQHRSCM